jgi:hypothetical protein
MLGERTFAIRCQHRQRRSCCTVASTTRHAAIRRYRESPNRSVWGGRPIRASARKRKDRGDWILVAHAVFDVRALELRHQNTLIFIGQRCGSEVPRRVPGMLSRCKIRCHRITVVVPTRNDVRSSSMHRSTPTLFRILCSGFAEHGLDGRSGGWFGAKLGQFQHYGGWPRKRQWGKQADPQRFLLRFEKGKC